MSRSHVAALALSVLGLSLFAGRTVEDFNSGWEFSRDQKSWTSVRVPHDWAIAGPFNPEGEASTGKLPWKGVGYYRKTLTLTVPACAKGAFDAELEVADPQLWRMEDKAKLYTVSLALRGKNTTDELELRPGHAPPPLNRRILFPSTTLARKGYSLLDLEYDKIMP